MPLEGIWAEAWEKACNQTNVIGPFLCRGVIFTLCQRCGVTPSDRSRWNMSVRRGSNTFSVWLLPRSSRIVFSAYLIKEAEKGSKPGLDCVLMFEMFFSMVVARVCIGGSSYTGARSLLRWKVVFMFLYLPPGPGGTAMSEGRICPDRNWPLSNWCRVATLNWRTLSAIN